MSPFSGSGVFGGPVSGSVFLLLSSSSFVFPLSFSGPAWVLFLCFLASLPSSPGLPSWSRQVRLSSCLWSVSSFFSLSPGRPPLPCPFLSLSSLSLFHSLACTPLTQTYPQYCWHFHDRLVRPSPGPLLQRGQPYSRGEFLDTLCVRFRGLSGFFRNFDRTVPAVLGVWPLTCPERLVNL